MNEYGPEFNNELNYEAQLNIMDNNDDIAQLYWWTNNYKKKVGKSERDVIIKLDALDHDCSLQFNTICHMQIIDNVNSSTDGIKLTSSHGNYSIHTIETQTQNKILNHLTQQNNNNNGKLTASQFIIDSNGNIRLAKEFNDDQLKSLVNNDFTFQVIAYDCAGRRSRKAANVTIKVQRQCKATIKGKSNQLISFVTSLIMCLDSRFACLVSACVQLVRAYDIVACCDIACMSSPMAGMR